MPKGQLAGASLARRERHRGDLCARSLTRHPRGAFFPRRSSRPVLLRTHASLKSRRLNCGGRIIAHVVIANYRQFHGLFFFAKIRVCASSSVKTNA
jgi:hypothetical protein